MSGAHQWIIGSAFSINSDIKIKKSITFRYDFANYYGRLQFDSILASNFKFSSRYLFFHFQTLYCQGILMGLTVARLEIV